MVSHYTTRMLRNSATPACLTPLFPRTRLAGTGCVHVGKAGFRSFTPSHQPRCFGGMPPKSKADFIKVSARLTHHAAAR